MHNRRVPPRLTARIVSYYEYLWTRMQSLDDKALLGEHSRSIIVVVVSVLAPSCAREGSVRYEHAIPKTVGQAIGRGPANRGPSTSLLLVEVPSRPVESRSRGPQ